MESENGKIIIRKNKKGKWIFEVDIGGKKPMLIPSFYDLKDDSLNDSSCDVFRENGKIKKILVDKKELPKQEIKKDDKKQKARPSKRYTQNNQQGYKLKDSFCISKTKVPKDTREVLKEFKFIDNFHLKLNKFARFDISDIKKPKEKKFILYRNKAKDLEDIEIKANFGTFNFKKNIEKQEDIVKIMFGENNYYKKCFKTDSRLLIGSEQSIYKTSIRLHHIYGIPYIPASAIKGVVRSYIIIEKFESKEEKALDNEDFKRVFGSQNQEGKVIFFDAFPTSKPKIKVDIMNPHYGDYYKDKDNKKKIAPTDTENPVPINFLTVENTTFEFFIASKEKIDESFIDLFKEALIEHGIGAKSAVGYGYME